MTEPTYTDGVRDCVEVLQQLLRKSDDVSIKVAISELESLHPRTRERRAKTRADKAEDALFQFACRIVSAAWNDWHAAQQCPNVGNTIANVRFDPTQVINWSRYAAARGHTPAVELLAYIEDKRPPIMMGI